MGYKRVCPPVKWGLLGPGPMGFSPLSGPWWIAWFRVLGNPIASQVEGVSRWLPLISAALGNLGFGILTCPDLGAVLEAQGLTLAGPVY